MATTMPSGVTVPWYFRQWYRSFPLYMDSWLSVGLHTWRSVPAPHMRKTLNLRLRLPGPSAMYSPPASTRTYPPRTYGRKQVRTVNKTPHSFQHCAFCIDCISEGLQKIGRNTSKVDRLNQSPVLLYQEAHDCTVDTADC